MAGFLLDTCVLIDFLNGKRGSEQLLKSLVADGHILGCCAVNVTEVYSGMRPKEKASTDLLLGSLEYFQVTLEIARMAGLFKRDFAKKGTTLSLADVTIAAVAVRNGLTLITGNARHFPMPELTLFRG